MVSSLISDSRILILAILVFVTIFIAIILIVIDERTKRRIGQKLENDIVDTKIIELDSLVKSSRDPKEKLGIINQKSKELFNEVFGCDESKGYTYLINFFNEKNLPKYEQYCRDMFQLFYSVDYVSNVDIEKIYKSFISIIELSRYALAKKLKDKNALKNIKPKIKKEIVEEKKNIVVSEQKKEEEKKDIVNESIKDYDVKTYPKKNNELFSEQQKIIDSIEKRKRELDFQQRKNLELLKQTETTLKQQQQLEVKLKKDLETQNKKKKNIEENLLNKKMNEVNNIVPVSATDKKWYHDIDAEPILGKDLVKELKKKRNI